MVEDDSTAEFLRGEFWKFWIRKHYWKWRKSVLGEFSEFTIQPKLDGRVKKIGVERISTA